MVEPAVLSTVSETIPTTDDAADAERVSTTVIGAIADRKNVDPIDLPPLYPEVDLDALDSLFHRSGAGEVSMVGQVTFEALGCEVVIEGPQQVTARPVEAETTAGLVE